jgi:hypothetical protein
MGVPNGVWERKERGGFAQRTAEEEAEKRILGGRKRISSACLPQSVAAVYDRRSRERLTENPPLIWFQGQQGAGYRQHASLGRRRS